jgi:hypothetical protein
MSNQATATIVADSICPLGVRLTTFQLRYWRPIHSELMTHRKFGRNAGSSRARPSQAIIDQVMTEPWGPIHWGLNEPGMQAHEELDMMAKQAAQSVWLRAAQAAASNAQSLLNIKAHKQIINRLLEPFTYIDVLVTATDFANWFALRDHEDAQPEIQELARLMKHEYLNRAPEQLLPGQWHLPYITSDDWKAAERYCQIGRITRDMPSYKEKLEIVRKISVARCARVSYRAFDGTVAPIEKDLALFEQLLSKQPLHASPAEHQATPDTMQWIQRLLVASPQDYAVGDDDEELLSTQEEYCHPELHGNLTGWIQYRKTLPNEYVEG